MWSYCDQRGREARCGQKNKINRTKTTHYTRTCNTLICGYVSNSVLETNGQRDASVCPLCPRGDHSMGERNAMLPRNLREGQKSVINQIHEIWSGKSLKCFHQMSHLRQKCTKFHSWLLSICLFVRLSLRWSLTLHTHAPLCGWKPEHWAYWWPQLMVAECSVVPQ